MDGKKRHACPTCGHRMILIKDVPSVGVLPALLIYKCQECGVPLTETVEAKDPNPLRLPASPRAHSGF
jgi:DNA-directed RNA polymerase subunit RPC12/RpoP